MGEVEWQSIWEIHNIQLLNEVQLISVRSTSFKTAQSAPFYSVQSAVSPTVGLCAGCTPGKSGIALFFSFHFKKGD